MQQHCETEEIKVRDFSAGQYLASNRKHAINHKQRKIYNKKEQTNACKPCNITKNNAPFNKKKVEN